MASEPEALLAVLKNPAYHFKRIGLEAGPLSQWLFSALADAGKLRMLLTHRKLLQSKAIAIENDLRGTLRNFGSSRSAWLAEGEV